MDSIFCSSSDFNKAESMPVMVKVLNKEVRKIKVTISKNFFVLGISLAFMTALKIKVNNTPTTRNITKEISKYTGMKKTNISGMTIFRIIGYISIPVG